MKNYLSSFLILTAPLAQYADEAKPKQPFIEYNNRISVFYPNHQTYERTKPNAFYVGVEAWEIAAISINSTNDETPLFHLLFEAELRFGYNFFYNRKDHITPIIGGGFIKDFTNFHSETLSWDSQNPNYVWRNIHSYSLPALGYGTLGFLYNHEFNTIFNLGFNCKGMIGAGGSNSHFNWGSPIIGVDMALPITFRFGYKRHWDFRIEPFYQYLHGSKNSMSYVGFRGTLGYRF